MNIIYGQLGDESYYVFRCCTRTIVFYLSKMRHA